MGASGGADRALLEVGGVRIAHLRLPAWEASDFLSVSEPSSISLSFTSQRGVTRSPSGSGTDRAVPADSLGVAGPDAIAWLRTDGPSELVEVTAGPDLRRAVADEVGASEHADLDQIFETRPAHPVAWAVGARLRSAARGGRTAGDLEVESLVRALYAHVLCARFGGRMPRGRGALDRRALDRVLGYIDAHLHGSLSVTHLAEVAAYSPFHFLRGFTAAVGVTPHSYVRMRRLEAARAAIRRGRPPRDALRQIGYRNLSHARAAYTEHFGAPPTGPGR